MKAVIMAGGHGTRIRSVASDIPKPMIPVLGKPVLQYQLECLKENGITDVILVTGYLADSIREYFG
ncbi:MAG: NTP transferase domain-containing protein, partial [Lachnospiraceae bacterium]|nr:NTP transferase domain-containing protein [Lachnospiraceae bacterium]